VEDKNVVVEEHELVIKGSRLKERQEMTIVGDKLTLRHTRWINDNMYEVHESKRGNEVISRKINTSMEGADEIDMFKQYWGTMWQPTITQQEIDAISPVDLNGRGSFKASEFGPKPRQLVTMVSDTSKSINNTAFSEDEKICVTDIEKSACFRLDDKSIQNEESDIKEEILKTRQLIESGAGHSKPETESITSRDSGMTIKVIKPSPTDSPLSTNVNEDDDTAKANTKKQGPLKSRQLSNVDSESDSSSYPDQGMRMLCGNGCALVPETDSNYSYKPRELVSTMMDEQPELDPSEEDGMRVTVIQANLDEGEGTSNEGHSAKKTKKRSAMRHFFGLFRKNKKDKPSKNY